METNPPESDQERSVQDNAAEQLLSEDEEIIADNVQLELLRRYHGKDLLIADLNINSIQNKFEELELRRSTIKTICAHIMFISETKIDVSYLIACKRRRISGCHLVPPKNNVCEPEPENDFCDVGILNQSQFSSNNPRTTARGIRCEEHSSFILSWNLIGQEETKVITSQKSFPGSGSQTLFFGGIK